MSNKKVPITRLDKFFSEEDFFFRTSYGAGMVTWGHEFHCCIISSG